MRVHASKLQRRDVRWYVPTILAFLFTTLLILVVGSVRDLSIPGPVQPQQSMQPQQPPPKPINDAALKQFMRRFPTATGIEPDTVACAVSTQGRLFLLSRSGVTSEVPHLEDTTSLGDAPLMEAGDGHP